MTRQLLLASALAVGAAIDTQAAAPASSENRADRVDWPAFLRQHDLEWDRMPNRWESAPFLGNGLVGTVIHAGGSPDEVRFWVCRSDVGRLDFPGQFRTPMRTVIGSFLLRTTAPIEAMRCDARLDLWNAEARGTIRTAAGEITWRAYVPTGEVGVVVETCATDGERVRDWRPALEGGGTLSGAGPADSLQIYEVADAVHHPRSAEASGGFAVAWRTETGETGETQRFFFAVGTSPVNRNTWELEPSTATAVEEATSSLERLAGLPAEQLLARHRQWWHGYYPRSFYTLNDAELESYYWIQLYKLAATTREQTPMIDNHGVWTVEPVYGFATWDLNVQSTYRLYLTANHMEFGEPLLRFLKRNFNRETMWSERHGELRAGMRQQTFLRYRFFDPEGWEHSPERPADGPAKFLWGCHNLWRHYRHTLDPKLLDSLLPMLEGGINAVAAHLETGEDGLLRVPRGQSWELADVPEPSGITALLDWALLTVIKAARQNGISEERIDRWTSLRARLGPLPTGLYADGRRGLFIGRDVAPQRHRHWTHLLGMFPLNTIDAPDAVEGEAFNSVDFWARLSAGLDGRTPSAGFSPPAAIQMYARLGREEPIAALLDLFLHANAQRGPMVWPNTMYREYGPVLETPFLFADALQAIALQSDPGRLDVFRGAPETLPDMAFARWRAEGGFVVTAQRLNGETQFVEVTSVGGEPVVLRARLDRPITEKGRPDAWRQLNRNEIKLHLAAGETLRLRAGNAEPGRVIRAIERAEVRPHFFGLNRTFLTKRPHIERYLNAPYAPELFRERE